MKLNDRRNSFAKRWIVLILLSTGFAACSTTEKVYLLSYGNLKGKKMPEDTRILSGEIAEGKDCGITFSLAKAFENALIQKQTEQRSDTMEKRNVDSTKRSDGGGYDEALAKYDTILNAEVTHTTGMFPPLNCIKVKGFAVNSKEIKLEGER